MKNPVRTYLNWYGRNWVEISEEPATKALAHYGKFALQGIAIAAAISAVVGGVTYAGCRIYQKVTEEKE